MKKTGNLAQRIWKARYLYLCLLPLLIWLVIFQYGPMYGVILAFKKYSARLGIWGSEWVGLSNFKRIFITPLAVKSIINTLQISVSRLVFEFPMGVIVAVLLTEMPGKRTKKAVQTILTFPHFLSWVVVACILRNFLASDGIINVLLERGGFGTVNFLGNESLFRPFLYVTANWKEMGWSAIIYMAAIAGIDPTLYEAASRLKRIWHITLPGIRGTIAIMFILAVGGIMSAGFDQIFNLNNAMVADSARILDIYIYDLTFRSVPDYGFTTAVGMFTAVVNLLMLLTANQVVYKLTGNKMFS